MAAEMKAMPKPEQIELVRNEILRVTGLNTQAFSGAQNPSSIYRMMVQNSPGIFPYYRELEEKDTAINSSLDMRHALIMARDRCIQAADTANGEAQRYADEASKFLRGIPKFRFALWELLDAPAYGFSVVEILWQLTGAGISAKLIGRPQELFRFGKLIEPQTGELLLANYPGGEGAPVSAAKFLVNTPQPRHGDRRGLPMLRRLFWPSWFKRQVLPLHLHFLEKGPGTVVVKYGNNASDEDKKKALEAAAAIATDMYAAVPESFALLTDALQSTRTRDANDFRTLIDYLDAEMTRIILGQTLTSHGSEQGRGAMALGQVHMEMMFEKIRNDAADLEDVLNEQLLAPWLLFTFGPQALEDAVVPRYVLEKDPPKDAAGALDLITKAHALVEVRKADVYEAAQLEQPQEGDDVVPVSAMPTSLFQPGA